jgi:hypothetical protein
MSNASRCKTYYQKIKADPERWKAFMEKRAAYKAGACEPCEPKRKPTQEERAALLAAFDEPAQSVAHLGGKHAAPATVYHGIPPEALIKQHREHWAKQIPHTIPLMEHPFVMDVQERIPCTKIKDLPPKEKPQ